MLRLVLAALRYRGGTMLALALLGLVAMAAGVSVPLYAFAADRYAVESEFRNAAPADRSINITAELPTPDTVEVALQGLLNNVRGQASPEQLVAITGVFNRGMALDETGAKSATAPLVARAGACDHVMVTGRCPQAANEVLISSATATRLGLSGLDGQLRYNLSGIVEPLTLRVVGTYEPQQETDGDSFWAGRVELVPQPLRATNPIFTANETFELAVKEAGAEKVSATVDLVIPGPDWPYEQLDSLRLDLVKAAADNGYQLTNGLPILLSNIEQARQRLRISAPLGAVTLLVLALAILILAAGHVARGRQRENALGLMRGTLGRHRFLLMRGPTLLVLLAAAPLGVAAGWLLVKGLTVVAFDSQQDPSLGWPALVAGGVVLLLAMVGVSVTERSRRDAPLLEALRGVPPRQRKTGLILDFVVAALAVAAIVQAQLDDESVVAMAAPVLAAATIGLLATRLVRPGAALAGGAWLRRGKLVAGLAAIQLARRPGAAQVVALVVVCLALVGQTADSWDRAERRAADRAFAELGAQQVLSVAAQSRPALLAATRKADPQGRWAMAVGRARMSHGRTMIAVDTSRLAAVSGVDLGVTGQLHPAANSPVTVDGNGLVLEVTLVEALFPTDVTAVLINVDGAVVTGRGTIPAEVGDHEVAIALAGCAGGCRLAWLSFERSPDEVLLKGLRQTGPDKVLLSSAGVSAAARWRTTFEMANEVAITPAKGAVSLRYRPSDPRVVSRDIRLQVADAPIPLPVAVVGDPELAHTQELMQETIFAGVERPITVVRTFGSIAGVPADGVLVDFEYADRLSDNLDNGAALQVWLGPDAPGDAVKRLEAAGLVLVRAESVTERGGTYRLSGDGLGLRLQLIAAALAIALALLAILVLAGTDRPHRLAELSWLREQGLSKRAVRRVARAGYLSVVIAALPVALAACAVAWWLTGAQLSPMAVAPPLLAAALLLAATAWWTDHRLARAVATAGPIAEAAQ